jgi:hypothetical protein
MKNLLFLVLPIFFTINISAQDLSGKRVAYSYIYTSYENGITEALDNAKLSSKEEKLNKKFRAHLDLKVISGFETYISESFKENGVDVLPLETIKAIKDFGLHGYPAIAFPKKTLKKHQDKDLADYFISANLSISKPLVNLVGMKPTANVTIKVFNASGELVNKYNKSTQAEEKLSSILFATKNHESFNKIDLTHTNYLYSNIEPAFKVTIDGIMAEIFNKTDGE